MSSDGGASSKLADTFNGQDDASRDGRQLADGVAVPDALYDKLMPHQRLGVKFLWDRLHTDYEGSGTDNV